ncbi:exported hypothetical protein [Candidatus Zixiibacteriota bacterium]|nr:exported hypothetical protein [candidate division Zixibacteria bacterium]
MKRRLILVTVVAVVLLAVLACSKKKTEDVISARQLLPEKNAPENIVRSSEIKTYVGNDLWQYIDGGAELYHLYNFQEVATADYKSDSIELVTDIYRFDNATDAFGLYSMLRPPTATIVLLGTEGFTSPGELIFVKGVFVVRIMGYEKNEAADKILTSLGQEIDRLITAPGKRPNAFLLFPVKNSLGASDKYYSQSFLGQRTLSRFYCQDYLLDGDTVTLFLSSDETGEKFLNWQEYATSLNKIQNPPDSLSYDSAKAFLIDDSFNGPTVVGLKRGKILGMMRYRETYRPFLSDWLKSFQ